VLVLNFKLSNIDFSRLRLIGSIEVDIIEWFVGVEGLISCLSYLVGVDGLAAYLVGVEGLFSCLLLELLSLLLPKFVVIE